MATSICLLQTENGNDKLLFDFCKYKFVFLGQQIINSNWRLLFQQILGHFELKIWTPKSAHIHLIYSQCICLNPYKIGPFGEPIKNGLLGRFPTLRQDDGDVKSGRRPPPPPPGSVGYVTVGGLFSAISRLRSMLNSNQKHW